MAKVDEIGPKVFQDFEESRVISRDDIVKDVQKMKDLDSVYEYIEDIDSNKK